MKGAVAALVVLVCGLTSVRAVEEWLRFTSAHYTVFYQAGFEKDVEFTRRWLDATEQLMMSKYGVTPDRYRMSVYLRPAPADGINPNQSGRNRCCTNGEGQVDLLALSAPVWKQSAFRSSLGLPKDGEDYHAKVIVSEYIPIGHYAVQDARSNGGWRYYSAPNWFVQGLQEYDAIFHSTQRNKTDTKASLLAWAKANRPTFACCATGLTMSDDYNGGAAFMTFLEAQFGEDIHAGLLRDGSATFESALANQTKPYQLPLLYDRFRAWLDAPEAAERPTDRFVTVNGVALQYVDWGGRGEAVLFLPGLGDDVHRFDNFAPHFVDRFHVLGFTRRGQGLSAKPAAGYDTNTLVEDIRTFLDAMHVERVNLIGHSIAGTEMTRFAERYPKRVRHLVYLDAAYDMADGRDAAVKAKLRSSSRADSPIGKIDDGASESHLHFRKVAAPALAFFVLYDTPNDPVGIIPEARLRGEAFNAIELGYKRDQVRIFKRDMARGRAVEYHDTDHFFFADPRKRSEVTDTIGSFLAQ